MRNARYLLIVSIIILFISVPTINAAKIDILEKYRFFDEYGYYKMGTNNNLINDIVVEQNFIWFATLGGVKVFNKLEKKFTYYSLEESEIGNHVSSIIKFQEQIWCGIRTAYGGGGLGRFNGQNWIFYDRFKHAVAQKPLLIRRFNEFYGQGLDITGLRLLHTIWIVILSRGLL